jgi:type VII secretion-associated protein (TIGR03931 family)
MTRDVVIVAGPGTIRGPGAVDAELAAAAINCIDDDVGLFGLKVQDAQHIWSDAIADAIGCAAARVTVVCPSFWPPNRIDTIRLAAHVTAAEVMIRDRRDALREVAGQPYCPVVEVGEDLVVLARPDGPAAVLRRSSPALAEKLVRGLDEAASVIIDVPAGIVGAEQLAAELSCLLDAKGTAVTILGCADLHRNAELQPIGSSRRTKGLALAAAAVVIALLTLAVFSGQRPATPPVAAGPELASTWLVEGQVAMQVPVGWTVDRVVSGGGSARVRVSSPGEARGIIHLTQTPVPARPSLAESARSLRAAAAGLRAGVIVDFNDAATAAGRSAVTYREVRADQAVAWTVLLDGTVRIAIGCQGPDIAGPCDLAIRSAHRAG